MFPQATPKSFARVTARSWRLTGKRSGKLRALKWKPACSRPRWAACCFTLRRNYKPNATGWSNFPPRKSKMRFDRMHPMTFDEGRKLRLVFPFAADELLNAAIRFVVGHLNRRMLGEICGWGMQHAPDAAIERKFATTDRIDCHTGRVRGIFDGKLNVDFHRYVAEEPAFHANKGNFVVKLPRHIIAWADVNILVCQPLADHRLHRFGFRSFLRRQASATKHVQEISIAAGVQLVRAHKFHAALPKEIHERPMQDRGAHLRLNIVPNEGQISISETLRPRRIARDEYGDIVDKAEPSLERTAGIKPGGLFGAHGEIIDHQFRGRVFQFGDDLFASGFFLQWKKCAERILIAHTRRIAIQNAAHVYNCAG